MLHMLINGIHLIACLLLILVIMLQQSKGGGLAGGLAGGTSQVFGGRGSANFMTRATGVLAVTFMMTSIALAYLSSAGDREMKAFDTISEEP